LPCGWWLPFCETWFEEHVDRTVKDRQSFSFSLGFWVRQLGRGIAVQQSHYFQRGIYPGGFAIENAR
jgi:hypothetical protein